MRLFRNEAMLVTGLHIALVAPFLWAPFAIDDPLTLNFARMALDGHLLPNAEPLHYLGRMVPQWRWQGHGPFWFGLYALFEGVAGESSEVTARLFALPLNAFATVMLLAFYRTFTRHALAATILTLASPAYLISATSIMGDVFNLGKLLAAFVLLERSRGYCWRYWGSWLFFQTCWLSSYQAIAFLPVILAWPLMQGHPWRPLAGYALKTVAAFLCWNVWTYASIGVWHSFQGGFRPETTGIFRLLMVYMNSLHSLALLGGVVLAPPVAFVLIGFEGMQRRRVAVMVAVAGVVLASPWLWTVVQMVQYLVFALCGAILLFFAAKSRRHPAEQCWLWIWVALAVAMPVFLLPFTCARYLLLGLPPLMLLVVERMATRPQRFLQLWGASAIASGALSLVLMASFQEQTTASRVLAARIASMGPEVRHMEDFTLGWYLNQRGASPALRSGEDVAPGQLLAVSTFFGCANVVTAQTKADLYPAPELASRLVPAESLSVEPRLPIGLMNCEDNLGFFATTLGLLPYGIATAPRVEAEVYEVAR